MGNITLDASQDPTSSYYIHHYDNPGMKLDINEINQGVNSVSTFYTKIKRLWDQLDDVDPLPLCHCANCNGNIAQRLLKSQQDKRSGNFDKRGINYYCDHCKMPGHSMQRCYKLHGYPPHFKNDDKNKRIAAVTTNSVESEPDQGRMLTKNIILKDVLYVEDCKFNLIYVPKICGDLNSAATFTSGTRVLQSSLIKPLVLGKIKRGLYYLEDHISKELIQQQSENKVATTSSSSLQDVNNTKLWHLRIGHLPIEQLEYVSSFSFVHNKPCLGGDFVKYVQLEDRVGNLFILML
uniref:GAG-pre-integrase domain-containing protein n=1 Tax=Chenopodium quinoa TaxID=63459 RepID=A0A803MM84_CHEQI